MKKLVRNLFAVIAATALVGSLASCADSDAEDPFATTSTNANSAGGNGGAGNGGGDNGNQGAQGAQFETVEVTSIAGKESSWGDDEFLKIGTDYTSKLTDGSKIYFDVAKKGDYLKFHVDNGSWGACGVTEYFNENGSKVTKIEEDTENAGVFNMEGEGGVYYVEVTSANIDKLKAGFAIHGNLVINKITLKIKKAAASTAGNGEGAGNGSGSGAGNQQQPGGQQPDGNGGNGENSRPAIGETVFTATGADLTIELPVNHYDDADHGIQFAPTGTKYLPKGAKSGEAYKIVMKGTASAEFTANVQFLTAAWAGFGEAINATFTTEAFDVEGVYTFGSDTAEGFMFVIGNSDATLTAKTLTLTEFTITRVEAGNGQAAQARSISGSAVEFTVANDKASSVSESSPVTVVLQYTRADANETAIKIDPAELKIYKGAELVKTVTKIEGFSLNVWGGPGNAFEPDSVQDRKPMDESNCKCFQIKIPLETVTSVSGEDKIKVHLVSGTVVGSGSNLAEGNLRASIGVGDDTIA